MAQALERALVGRRHRPEQPGMCGRSASATARLRRATARRCGARRRAGAAAGARDGRSRRARFPVRADRPGRRRAKPRPPRSAGPARELRRQILVADAVIGELGAAADDRPLRPVEPDSAIGRDADGEHHRRARAVRQQAGRAFRQRRRIEPGLAVGQIGRSAARPRLDIERIAVPRRTRRRRRWHSAAAGPRRSFR